MNTKAFIDSLVPANYFLTKSMELSRITSCGTLWYTKKFLVYYYYIFLSDNIMVRADADNICEIFDQYIDSLPTQLQSDANNFFYSDSDVANPKSPRFRFFSDFAGNPHFDTVRERNDYYEMAKKYYFAFLMESGGQSGVKAHIKSHIYRPDFVFNQIDSIIESYYFDRDEDYSLTGIKNDYMAFLRNERQILFYYGYFHSKSNGSYDTEFSSLTPIGELALKSDNLEFLAIWEHQKIKMISQPVTVDIREVRRNDALFNPANFAINTDPYYTLLKSLHDLGSVSSDEYQFVVSRLKSYPEEGLTISQAFLDAAARRVRALNRRRDLATEDFHKELKKYILGVRSDLDYDDSTNPIGFCRLGRGTSLEITDSHKLEQMLSLLSGLKKYKEVRYGDLYAMCENELRKQYIETLDGRHYIINSKIKVEWDMYNIHVDIPIMLSALVFIVSNVHDLTFNDDSIMKYVQKMREMFPVLLSGIGLASKIVLTKKLKQLHQAFTTEDFSRFMIVHEDEYEVGVAAYWDQTLADLERKILDNSDMPSIIEEGCRKRNTALIHLIKSYNIQKYSVNSELMCECCGQKTFTTYNNESYMEYHHLIPFSTYDGADHYLNIFALCPMCHRKMHFIKLVDKEGLYADLSSNNYRNLSIEDRLKQLREERKLKSYQLEFLLADKAIDNDMYNRIIQCA